MQVVNFNDLNRPVAFLFNPVLLASQHYMLILFKASDWQLSKRVPVFLRYLKVFISFFLVLLTNTDFMSAFGLKFKAFCRKEPDAVIVSSITG